MPARPSGTIVWGLTAAIVGLICCEFAVLERSGDHELIEALLVVLAALAVGFALVSARMPPRSPEGPPPPAEPPAAPP